MENKTGKYLKYAIGEIILVVIGILIALSINNWNEDRQKVTSEINILNDIKSDLQENIINLEKGIEMLEIANKDILQVINLYNLKTPYHDSLVSHFANFISFWDPDFTYAGFENLKSQGVNLISNQKLRKHIINLIEVEMDILDNSDMSRMDQITTSMLNPIIKKYFYRDLDFKGEFLPLIPSNYSVMIQDPEFYNVCTEIAYRQQRSIKRFNSFNARSKDLIAMIDSEIKLLE